LCLAAVIDDYFSRNRPNEPRIRLRVEHVLVSTDRAVVELQSLATARNGLKSDNRYCWACRFAADKIALTSIRLSWLACSKRIQLAK
jgi:ketosteroid isomerase-like protein